MLNTKKQRNEDRTEEKVTPYPISFRLALKFLASLQFISGLLNFDLIGQGSRAQGA
jgi:hypothetical protein